MTRFIRILAATANSSRSQPSAPPPEAVALESDFVVILAALLCALICMVGLIAVARCAWLRRASGGTSATSNHPSANKGLKKKTLQSLPKFTFSHANSSPGESKTRFSAECAICLGEFVEGDEIRMLPQCGHCFHMKCVDTWLGSHSSCPFCRQILVVARCQKCGQFPAVVGAAHSEQELKAREDDNANNRGFLP